MIIMLANILLEIKLANRLKAVIHGSAHVKIIIPFFGFLISTIG